LLDARKPWQLGLFLASFIRSPRCPGTEFAIPVLKITSADLRDYLAQLSATPTRTGTNTAWCRQWCAAAVATVGAALTKRMLCQLS